MQEPTDAWVTEKIVAELDSVLLRLDETGTWGTTRLLALVAAYGAWKEAAGAKAEAAGERHLIAIGGRHSKTCRVCVTAYEYDTRSAALVRLVEGE